MKPTNNQHLNPNTMTFEEKEHQDFADNAKWKTASTYIYFTVNTEKQIRITKNGKTTQNTIKYYVTLHTIDEDNITYKPQEKQEAATSLKEAKTIAGKYYYQTIRS